MRSKTILSIVGAAAALSTGAVAATGAIAQSSSTSASSAQASQFARHIEGPIVAIDRAARTFTVRDREHRSALSTIHVTRNTRFDGVAGFGALHKGQQIDVRAVRANGTLSATKVESSGRAAGASVLFGTNRGSHREVEPGDDRGADRRAEVGDDRGHDGPGHDRGDDRGHGGHRGHDG
jgi:hypothetical protein